MRALWYARSTHDRKIAGSYPFLSWKQQKKRQAQKNFWNSCNAIKHIYRDIKFKNKFADL